MLPDNVHSGTEDEARHRDKQNEWNDVIRVHGHPVDSTSRGFDPLNGFYSDSGLAQEVAYGCTEDWKEGQFGDVHRNSANCGSCVSHEGLDWRGGLARLEAAVVGLRLNGVRHDVFVGEEVGRAFVGLGRGEASLVGREEYAIVLMLLR